jgi:Mor family transcriptional regulator
VWEETLSYKNAREILPEALLLQIQEYVEGETLYIPKRTKSRAAWGSCSGARKEYEARNEQIRKRYAAHASIEDLAREFCLSAETIRKIV